MAAAAILSFGKIFTPDLNDILWEKKIKTKQGRDKTIHYALAGYIVICPYVRLYVR